MTSTVMSACAGADHAVVRVCRELARALVAGNASQGRDCRLEVAAAGWARAGVPLEWIHQQLGESVKHAVAHREHIDSRGEFATLADRLTGVLATVSTAYLGELSGPQSTRARLVSVLLSGEDPAMLARECGVSLAQNYAVLAVAFPVRGPRAAAGHVRRLDLELARLCGSAVLARFADGEGTVLVPAPGDETALDELIGDLSVAAGTPLTAATVSAARSQLADAARRAHDLLDIAILLGREGAVHRIGDLAAEYQLSRPGPARDHLAALLDPVDNSPHLMDTLLLHLRGTLSRRSIARHLGVHANTVEYRLKRVALLTGIDPFTMSGRWQLQCALIARSHVTTPSP